MAAICAWVSETSKREVLKFHRKVTVKRATSTFRTFRTASTTATTAALERGSLMHIQAKIFLNRHIERIPRRACRGGLGSTKWEREAWPVERVGAVVDGTGVSLCARWEVR